MFREDFPMLKKDIIYFNNAATTLTPQVVIDEISNYYTNYNYNLGRGVDSRSYELTMKFEKVREKVAEFIGSLTEEIVFTRGTTESINMIALSLEDFINENDEILVSNIEHHSNFLPWQELALKKGAKFVVMPVNEEGVITPDIISKYITSKTKVVALNHVSNTMGGINPIKEISKIVRTTNAYFIVDGAQGILSEEIDVINMDVDFYCFSGHKMYGPNGVGVLYGKKSILDKMKPVYFGGEMVSEVGEKTSNYKILPYKFEAGTMMIPEVLGLGAAIDYINNIGREKIKNGVLSLRKYLVSELEKLDNVTIYNKGQINTGIVNFNVLNIHSHDVASFLDKEKIIVRAGHHCAEPFMNSLNVNSTIRVSLAFYNTKEEIDKFINVLRKVGDSLDFLF